MKLDSSFHVDLDRRSYQRLLVGVDPEELHSKEESKISGEFQEDLEGEESENEEDE